MTQIYGGEPAHRAGLRLGDVIEFVNRQATRNVAEFQIVCGPVCTGPLDIQVRRRGQIKLFHISRHDLAW